MHEKGCHMQPTCSQASSVVRACTRLQHRSATHNTCDVVVHTFTLAPEFYDVHTSIRAMRSHPLHIRVDSPIRALEWVGNMGERQRDRGITSRNIIFVRRKCMRLSVFCPTPHTPAQARQPLVARLHSRCLQVYSFDHLTTTETFIAHV